MHAYSRKLLIQLIKKVCYIELNCLSFSYFVYMMYVSISKASTFSLIVFMKSPTASSSTPENTIANFGPIYLTNKYSGDKSPFIALHI